MNVLGISGRYREAAAALAIDGQITAAASEDCFVRVPDIGYAQTGGFPHASVAACLERTGLTVTDIDHVTVVDAEGAESSPHSHVTESSLPAPGPSPTASSDRIDALHADALQAAASVLQADTLLVCSAHPPAMVAFTRQRAGVDGQRSIPGGDQLAAAARRLASHMGVAADDPYRSLDRLSVGGEPEFQPGMAHAIQWKSTGIAVDHERLSQLVAECGGGDPAALANAESLNARTQETRRSLAASFICQLAHVVRDVAHSFDDSGQKATVALGGSLAAGPRFNTELRGMGDALLRAVVPEAVGRALGAAMSQTPASARLSPGAQLPGLALGPVFSDHDIKRTLDNCRLDYVYEPDWQRLMTRVSTMLAQGKVVGWFQGPMTFGPRVLGARSVLCDPSNRYARLNVNEYLRRVPLDEPLPVVFAPSAAPACLPESTIAPPNVVDVAVKEEWRERLISALDWRKQVRVQAMGPAQAPELCDLLERHFERTQVPALIETRLGGMDEPVACTPRDAVRTVYSSAIDALVVGRFLLMKDYWLLRSDGA